MIKNNSGDPPRGPAGRRLLRRLGRPLLLVRLRSRRRAPQGGPLELHRRGGPHRRLPAAAHGPGVRGQVRGVRRGPPGDDRGAGHPADEDDGAAAGAADARRRAADLGGFGPLSRRNRRRPGAGAEHDPGGAPAAAQRRRRRRGGGEQQRAEWRRGLFRGLVWRGRRQGGGRFLLLECSLLFLDSGGRPDDGPFRSAADACGAAGRGLGGGQQQWQRRRRRRRRVVQVKKKLLFFFSFFRFFISVLEFPPDSFLCASEKRCRPPG